MDKLTSTTESSLPQHVSSSRIIVKLAVIAAGLFLGAIMGVVVALFTGLIEFVC